MHNNNTSKKTQAQSERDIFGETLPVTPALVRNILNAPYNPAHDPLLQQQHQSRESNGQTARATSPNRRNTKQQFEGIRSANQTNSASPTSRRKKWPFYAVAKGKNPGTYTTWEECERNVRGIRPSLHEGFRTRKEADEFVRKHTDHHEGMKQKRVRASFSAHTLTPQTRGHTPTRKRISPAGAIQ